MRATEAPRNFYFLHRLSQSTPCWKIGERPPQRALQARHISVTISQSCFGKPNTVCGPMPFTKEHFIIKPVPVKKQKHRKSSVSTILLSTNIMELFCILIALIQEQSSGFNAESKYTRMLELKIPKAVI